MSDRVRTRRAARAGAVVEVHIGHLVIEGVPLSAADATRMRSAVEGELRRALASAPTSAWRATAVRDVPAAVHLAPDGSAAIWGRQIARTLAAGLRLNTAGPTRSRGGG